MNTTQLLLSGAWTQGLQLFAALSILIIIHEGGHFVFAKLFKTRVEKFYLFFDFLFPFSGLLNFSLFKKKKGDTEYGIGWFPLGGYVKIAGMVDESMDKEQLAQEPQPWEYRSKKAYQKLGIMLGGIIFNIIAAMIIYAFIFGIWGEHYLPTNQVKYGIEASEDAKAIGFKNGDKIISIGGVVSERFNDNFTQLILSQAKTVEVERDGLPTTIAIPAGTIKKLLSSGANKKSIWTIRTPFTIKNVLSGSAAEKMGLKEKDSIVAINNQPIHFFDELQSILFQLKNTKIMMIVIRENHKSDTLSGWVPSTGKIGVEVENEHIERYFNVLHKEYNFKGAVVQGVLYTFDRIGFYVQQFVFMLTSKEVKAKDSVGGMITFAKQFPTEFTWLSFLSLTAFISIILAFMNLLPIPGLDGGYVVFLLFEMLTGKKVSEKVMEKATTVGLVLLLALMVYANGMDIFRLFK
jgi:regulator of sigma E protease